MKDMFIDIGATSQEEAEAGVRSVADHLDRTCSARQRIW